MRGWFPVASLMTPRTGARSPREPLPCRSRTPEARAPPPRPQTRPGARRLPRRRLLPRRRRGPRRTGWRARPPSTTAAMLLDGSQEPRRAERAAADLEVPAVVLAAAQDRSAALSDRGLDGAQALLDRAPAFAPERAFPRQWRREEPRSPPAPGGKA